MTEQKKDTVSVIIPTFNRAWTLKRAVDSALAQDYRHREIIVVDDGSTDLTQELLAGYGDKIRVLVQENKGVSAARNLGIQESRGCFIALLDSDDAWEKNKLSWILLKDLLKNHWQKMVVSNMLCKNIPKNL